MAQLASSFEEYGQWRDSLSAAIVQLRQWLVDADMLDWVKEWNTGKTLINGNTVITL